MTLDPAIYRSLFGAYPDGLLLVDADGVIHMANPAACALLGYSAVELAGRSVESLVPDRVRERHAAYRNRYADAPRARAMGTQSELVAVRSDGSEVMVEIALSPLHGQGLPYVVAAVRAIGDYPRVRQAIKRGRYGEAMAHVAGLAAAARDAASLVARTAEVARDSLQARSCVIFLLEPDLTRFRLAGGVGLLPGEALGDVVPNQPLTAPGFVLASAGPVQVEDYARERRFEVPASHLAGGLRRGLAVPLADSLRPMGALIVRAAADVDFGDEELRFLQSLGGLLATCLQRLDTEEQLHHAQRLDSVGQLTGGIAHDFNNLLTIVMGNLQVLEEKAQRARSASARADAAMLAAASRAAQRGADLTRRLLAFSRRQLLSPGRVDACQVVLSLAGMLRRTLDEQVLIETDLPASPLYLHADPAQFESALLNLAINARDAMPEGGRLRLAVRHEARIPPEVAASAPGSASGPCVAVTVSDSGTGMSEAVRVRAFEPFFTTKDPGRGTGLGLATVYGFVHQSSGAVALETAPGQGTSLTLYLPQWQEAKEATPDEAGGMPGAPAPVDGPAPLRHGLRVLLVEDDPVVRQVVVRHLRRLGAKVHACAAAEEAMSRIEQGEPVDLLLSDVSLGRGMPGTELATRVRALRPKLPVLLMTGYAAAQADNAAAWPMLRKPFDRDTLAAAVRQALDQ